MTIFKVRKWYKYDFLNLIPDSLISTVNCNAKILHYYLITVYTTWTMFIHFCNTVYKCPFYLDSHYNHLAPPFQSKLCQLSSLCPQTSCFWPKRYHSIHMLLRWLKNWTHNKFFSSVWNQEHRDYNIYILAFSRADNLWHEKMTLIIHSTDSHRILSSITLIFPGILLHFHCFSLAFNGSINYTFYLFFEISECFMWIL